MAIFFCMAKIVTRSKGQNVIAHAAYNARDKLRDQNDNSIKDYRRQSDIIDSGIIAPQYAPDWMQNRETLWNEVEKRENRRDAQLARSYVIALPNEFSNDENKGIVKSIGSMLSSQGIVVDYAIHPPKSDEEADQRNVHAHFCTTLREIKPDGFGNKVRAWNDREWLYQIKLNIGNIINEKLREKNLPEIDARSFEEQNKGKELDKIKQGGKHLGAEKVNNDRDKRRKIKKMINLIDKENQRNEKYMEVMGYGGYDGNAGEHRKQDGVNRDKNGRNDDADQNISGRNQGNEKTDSGTKLKIDGNGKVAGGISQNSKQQDSRNSQNINTVKRNNGENDRDSSKGFSR
ncbi:MAG: hypothetical protein Ta2C_10800 [Candidatus Endomicrobiellum trichonymphae]|uniref:MobA/MobL family protein n=1 Tax=Endomicrobium trichonymphae TaxID=1408204 RepID=UPI0027D3A4BD|nr:MAG: hypothetical protein Ta2C_10800 [Candidatus Endomicrobium trichonymphae]